MTIVSIPPSPLDSLPAAPGIGAVLWRCTKCGSRLGVVFERWLFSRHKGRDIAACLPARIQCESCGRKNGIPRPGAQADHDILT